MFAWINLLFLCCTLSPALCCDWLKHYGHLSNSTRSLLHVMGDPLTEQTSPVHFPSRLYSNIRKAGVESQLSFVRDSLKMILDLYRHDNHSSFTWDTDKYDGFLRSVARQLDGLNSCVPPNRAPARGLRRYYRKLRRTLYRTGGGAESWELIRKETKRHLDQLDLLIAVIRNHFTAV
ncbi:interferon phi 1 [Brachionichthys hirsutus]|uniref:interferon phi 1 n=1 Tax=Brachionichthys hirsutus TaxID=412623 RepID=UPI00360430AF